jgi:hypothetical protein
MVADKPVLPLGIRAEIDPQSRTFSLVEGACFGINLRKQTVFLVQ